jgi:hypothetical protein
MCFSNSKVRKVVFLMMRYVIGIPRNRLFFSSSEDAILPETPVRFIDAFVEALSLQTLGFSIQTSNGKIARALILKSFFKIYLYEYLNGIRSVRDQKKNVLDRLKYNGF